MRYMSLIKLLFLVVLLSGCENEIKPEKQGKKMEEFFTENTNTPLPKLKQHGVNAGFVRTQATELENNFPKLPNPTLNMFVYPHLTKQGNPVPGYTTNFKLYKKANHYALPGEVF